MRRLGAILALSTICCGPNSPPGSTATAPDEPQLFAEKASETGLAFEHFIGAPGKYLLPEIMGSGVALLDYDADGDLDVFFAQGKPLESTPSGLTGNKLFENRVVPDGTLTFRDATADSDLQMDGYAMGAAVGDFDSDGDPDLYVTALGPNALFRNDSGKFRQIPGPQDERWSTSATFVDYDADGDLDLFFTNYVDFSVRNNKQCFDPTGARDYCAPTVYNPVPDRLFRNDGNRFTDVSRGSGLGEAFGNGLGVTTADFNNDGAIDIYVANDGTENQLWINQGDGTFTDRGMISGTAVNADGRAEAGMGVAAADFDNDGDEDLFMSHLALETNTLYLNNGQGAFRDATNRFGLGSISTPFTGFGLQWRDFDLDGRLDLFVANGAVTVMEAQRGDPHPFLQGDQYFRGAETGFEAIDGTRVWGALDPLVGRGLASGDLDKDGDLDVVVSHNNGPARLFINQTSQADWVRVALRGTESNRDGLGARVGLRLAAGGLTWRRVQRDGSYLSSSEPTATFAVPAGQTLVQVEVLWPSGKRESFSAPPTATATLLEEGSGQ